MKRPELHELARITFSKTWDEKAQEYVPEVPVWVGDQRYAGISGDFAEDADPRFVRFDGDFIDLNGMRLHIVDRYSPPHDFILVEKL